MNDQAVVDRAVRSHNRRPRADLESVGRLDLNAIAVFDFNDSGPGKNATAKIDNCSCDPVEIFERMKLTLPRKPQHRVAIELPDRDTVDSFNVVQTGAMNSFEFRF